MADYHTNMAAEALMSMRVAPFVATGSSFAQLNAPHGHDNSEIGDSVENAILIDDSEEIDTDYESQDTVSDDQDDIDDAGDQGWEYQTIPASWDQELAEVDNMAGNPLPSTSIAGKSARSSENIQVVADLPECSKRYCKEKATHGFKTCPKCREKATVQGRKHRAERIKAGKCVASGCQNSPKEGSTACQVHLDSFKTRHTNKKTWREQKKCTSCGLELDPRSKAKCTKHFERGRARYARKKDAAGQTAEA